MRIAYPSFLDGPWIAEAGRFQVEIGDSVEAEIDKVLVAPLALLEPVELNLRRVLAQELEVDSHAGTYLEALLRSYCEENCRVWTLIQSISLPNERYRGALLRGRSFILPTEIVEALSVFCLPIDY